MFNADADDLYYSIPQNILLENVEDCIAKDDGEYLFINACGIKVSSSMVLLGFHLNSAFVS